MLPLENVARVIRQMDDGWRLTEEESLAIASKATDRASGLDGEEWAYVVATSAAVLLKGQSLVNH